jgi:hypothetical protein
VCCNGTPCTIVNQGMTDYEIVAKRIVAAHQQRDLNNLIDWYGDKGCQCKQCKEARLDTTTKVAY